MYHQIVIEFEPDSIPNISSVYKIANDHFEYSLKWFLHYASGIRDQENPCDNWDIEYVGGYGIIDDINIHNFDTTDSAQIFEALFVASTKTPDYSFTKWHTKPFFDQNAFSLRVVEQGIFQIHSADTSIFALLKKLDSIYTAKIFASEDSVNWEEIAMD
jgi:hypothetical protein